MNSGESWDKRTAPFDMPVKDVSNPFLSIVMKYAALSNQTTDVLDIGCGTGIYSLGLADNVRSVTGVDVSEKMIELAKGKAAEIGASNSEFRVLDWESPSASRIGRFNLTIAHMTPAIHDGPSFAKMLSVSSGWCFLAGYIARESPVWDEIYRIVGEPSRPEYMKLIDAQETLWKMGKAPKLDYIRSRRGWTWTSEYTKMFYTEAVRSYTSFSDDQEKMFCEWVDSHSADGMFHDESDPVIGVLSWDMGDSL